MLVTYSPLPVLTATTMPWRLPHVAAVMPVAPTSAMPTAPFHGLAVMAAETVNLR